VSCSASRQFVASNYVSVPLTDIIASLLSAAAVVVLVRVWHPAEVAGSGADRRSGAAVPVPMVADGTPQPAGRARVGARACHCGDVLGDRRNEAAAMSGHSSSAGDADTAVRATPRRDCPAYAPYLIIIAIFTIANLGPIKEALAGEPWTVTFPWPGLDVLGGNRQAAVVGHVRVRLAARRRNADDPGRHPHRDRLRVRPGRALKAYVDTYVELRTRSSR
jgi:lactate permease